jgi:hypothetical protein
MLRFHPVLRLIRLGAVLIAAETLCRAQVPANLLPVVDSSGGFVRTAGEDVKIISVSESGLTLECSQKASAPGVQPFTWRERYAVRDGRLVLDAVLAPHIVPPQPAHTEWQVSTTVGTSTIGPMAMDPRWKDYRDYLQSVIQMVQDAWAAQLAENRIPSSSGSTVSVTFVLNSKGEVSRVVGTHPSPEAPPGVGDVCVTAINKNAPYGGWTDDMISALGNEQQLTFSFHFP